MDAPWTKFWFGISVVGWTGFLAGPALGQLGSAAEWAAGLATVAAVYVSLRTARNQGNLALKVAEDDRLERADAERANSLRLLKAALIVVNSAHASMSKANADFAQLEQRRTEYALAVLESPATTIITESLGQFRLDQLPTTTSVDLIMAARASWAGVVDRLMKASSDWVETFMDEELVDVTRLDQAAERLADEIVRLGGRGDTFEDIGVQLRLGVAEARARLINPH
ncbi:hypothetical protein ACIQC9_08230 [Brevundimonas sp. NPDC092305]|uniref:hypothetical protein n=1 Tax=Brevundimonas sp. NPDC092305 TaxID=3363957 RepID=UPI003812C8D1